MKKIYQLFIIITFAFISIACSGGDQDSPENAVIAFFEAGKEGNTEKMGKLLYFGKNGDVREYEKRMGYSKFTEMMKLEMSKIEDMEVIDVSYNEDKTTAVVKIKVKGKYQEREDFVRLVDIDGKWFIIIK